MHGEKTSNVLLVESFQEFLRLIRADVVHIHHFMLFGIDFLTLIRRTLPECNPLFSRRMSSLTICAANGHMVRRTDQSLCTRASAVRCHQCLPERPPEHYFMREMWMKTHLAAVDVFTTPSRFMIEQFCVWGLEAEKFVYVTKRQGAAARPGEQRGYPWRGATGSAFLQLVDAERRGM